MVTCWMCGKEFEPDRERLRLWAESGRNFDPTDWECSTCSSLTLSDEPALFCSQCGTKLSVIDFHINGLNGWADAKCMTCGGFHRYMRTPATLWESVINLENYYAYAARPRPNTCMELTALSATPAEKPVQPALQLKLFS